MYSKFKLVKKSNFKLKTNEHHREFNERDGASGPIRILPAIKFTQTHTHGLTHLHAHTDACTADFV